MNEKRFYITETGLGLDTVSDEMYSFGDEEDFCRLFDKLNEQQAIITELNKQIEQLNLAIDDLLSHTSCEEVKKENSDLRQNITIIKDLLSECDLFSDKATKHDIIAYKEMRQFDNKDAYCICTAIKKAIEKLKRCNDE